MTLRAQGLVGADSRRGGVTAMLRRLGAVQLDTISVLARSHELVAYARLGPVGRERVERAYWHPRLPDAFEYWSHAACVLPIEEWPYYGFRRRALLARGQRWHQSHPDVCAAVLARIRAEGPLTATELGGAKKGGPWWDWSDTKIAVEWLLDTGEVICVRRTGWRRVYDLPERVLPPELLAADPSDDECVIRLAAVAGRALGVATQADLADYQRLRCGGTGQQKDGQVLAPHEAAAAAGLVPVEIAAGRPDGTPLAAWADPRGPGPPGDRPAPDHAAVAVRLAGLGPQAHAADVRLRAQPGGLRARRPSGCTATSPCRCWPAAACWAGSTRPARAARSSPAGSPWTRPAAAEPMARALTEAAAWVGCDSVALEQVSPPGLRSRLESALASAA